MTSQDWLDLEIAFCTGTLLELERKRVEREKRAKVQAEKRAVRSCCPRSCVLRLPVPSRRVRDDPDQLRAGCAEGGEDDER